MFETRNTHVNAALYIVMLIGLIDMILWFGIFPAWLGGVFGGAGLFGTRPTTLDYLMVIIGIILPLAIYIVGAKKHNLLICAFSCVIPYAVFTLSRL